MTVEAVGVAPPAPIVKPVRVPCPLCDKPLARVIGAVSNHLDRKHYSLHWRERDKVLTELFGWRRKPDPRRVLRADALPTQDYEFRDLRCPLCSTRVRNPRAVYSHFQSLHPGLGPRERSLLLGRMRREAYRRAEAAQRSGP